MKRRRFLLVFDVLDEVHLGKDVGLFPLYAGLLGFYDPSIAYLGCRRNRDLVSMAARPPLRLERIPIVLGGLPYRFPLNIVQSLLVFAYLHREARRIDLLMLFHAKRPTLWLARLYRWRNPGGKVWIKLDMDGDEAVRSGRVRLERYTGVATMTTVESKILRDSLNSLLPKGSRQVAYLPNGYDDLGHPVDRSEVRKLKEKLFITVGRLGTRQKNSELFLEAIGLSTSMDARFCLIGPATEEFKACFEDFRLRFPEKAGRVSLLGEIRDKAILHEWYARARAFVLPSRWESFGLVLLEALAHGDYLISTDLPASRDIIDGDPAVGRIVAQEDAVALAQAIDEIAAAEDDPEPRFERSTAFYQSAMSRKLETLLSDSERI